MNDTGSALPSGKAVSAGRRSGVVEAVIVVCLAIVLLLVSVPFIELTIVWIPQLILLALFSGALAMLDSRFAGTTSRAVAATIAALVVAGVGLATAFGSGRGPVITDNQLIFTLPFTIGAGVAGGTWVARPGTPFGLIVMRAFEGMATTIVFYVGSGVLLSAIRS